MIRTKNDLSPDVRHEMAELLNARLADAVDLYTHAKHAHWNVRGARFLSLHELFDKVAEMAEEHADEIAERAAQLGSEVHGTLRAAARSTSLRSYPHAIASGEDHVEALSDSLAMYGHNVREGIDLADDAGDADTADMFTDLSRATDKILWFVESHLTPAMADQSGGREEAKQAEPAMASSGRNNKKGEARAASR